MSVIFEGVKMPTACCFVDGEHSEFDFEYCRFYNVCKQRETVKTNYKPSDCPVKALEQEPTTKNNLGVDCISRESIKQKLQEHHDFFVDAYGGFNNLPQNDKSRVDEITNCIAMIVNEPPVTPLEPRKGHWIVVEELHGEWEGIKKYACNKCGEKVGVFKSNYCPNCGADMREVTNE